ncbi:PKD domain-containing protein [Methanoplanus limicola]|uniref:PKD domain containing protein n=1 Tax=Methanoplanus limicola DSM 2279 TaxID=937775 RepID=H1YZS8_9EURY|nr:PKD domain-containing protein [Methanoplanus limicola]EHQ34340.1 PKD domain containing protein [Methanoplanus limicola DSM 2279]
MMILKKGSLLLIILLISAFTGSVAAGGTGVLSSSNATDVKVGEIGYVIYSVDNNFNPLLWSMGCKIYYDSDVAEPIDSEKISSYASRGNTYESGMKLSLLDLNKDGIPNGETGIYNFSFRSKKNDGSRMELGIVIDLAKDVGGNTITNSYTSVNGTFVTLDEVAPVINNITTSANVAKDFKVTGFITEVGGMGSANATVSNTTASQVYNLTLTNLGSGLYSYSADVSWPVFETGVKITVNAVDAKDNHADAVEKTVNVVNAGFSSAVPEGYIKTRPVNASAYMNNIDQATVTMIIGGNVAPTNLALTFLSGNTGYVIGDLTPLSPLADGNYWVNVSGTDTIAGDKRHLNWTFVLDTATPTLALTITDSDGDGYIEANEDLTFNWNAGSFGASGFKNVEIIDKKTSSVLWTDDSGPSGVAVQNFTEGNRDLSFRAYSNAGNYAAEDFHLYNNYIVWINSTKFGTISGIETNYTAMVSLDLTDTSNVMLYNGSSVNLPAIGTVSRNVTGTGQVTSDTYVTVDKNANATYPGADTYQKVGYYGPSDVIDFEITAPAITHANVLLMEANETYINQLVDQKSVSGINYTELIRKTAYIFIEGGWTKITVLDDGTFIQDEIVGNRLTVEGSITDTLKKIENQVDFSTGYRLSEDCVIGTNKTITPAVGDYALGAISFDAERIGIIGVMPVVFTESTDQGTVSGTRFAANSSFDAGFTDNCKYFGVGVYRDTEYNASVLIDFAKINADMISAELKAGGVPATQKLWHNIYISPDSGNYAYAKNSNNLTFDLSGLKVGNYKAVLAGLSNKGTAQAVGVHDFTILPPLPVANFTAEPLVGTAPLTVNFTDSSLYSPTTWEWYYSADKGSNWTLFDTVQNPVNVFTPGNYSIMLNVTNANGAGSKSIIDYIQVNAPALVPVANFTATPLSGQVPLTVQFNDTSINYPTTWGWYYSANGGTTWNNFSMCQNPSYQFASTGTYSIMLNVSNAFGGNSTSKISYITVSAAPTPVPTPVPGPSGGGGGGGGGYSGGFGPTVPSYQYTGEGVLETNNLGQVQGNVEVVSPDGGAKLLLSNGVQVLDANGRALSEVSVTQAQAGSVPGTSGALYKFGDFVYECLPAGAQFDPSIDIKFELTEAQFNALNPGQTFSVRYYDGASWVEVPTYVNPNTREVIGEITHFTYYALMAVGGTSAPVVPGAEVVPTEQPTGAVTPTGEETPSPDEGMPGWIWIVLIVVIIAVAGAVFYLYKEGKLGGSNS